MLLPSVLRCFGPLTISGSPCLPVTSLTHKLVNLGDLRDHLHATTPFQEFSYLLSDYCMCRFVVTWFLLHCENGDFSFLMKDIYITWWKHQKSTI
jgi:hypothetical protein